MTVDRGGGPRAVRAAAAFYGLLLRVYPARFRERNGREMERFFRDAARDAWERGGAAAVAAHTFTATLDVASTAWAEHTTTSRGGGGGMEGLTRDVRYALRSLARAPGFTAVAVITLALGIGANTAIFSVVRGVLLRPLPYPEPEELVMVWAAMTERGVTDFPVSPPDFRDYREMNAAFEDIAGVFTFELPLTGDFEPQQIMAAGATTSLFDVLGVRPALGRGFRPGDGEFVAGGLGPGDPGFAYNAVVLSDRLWRQRFGADPGALGRIIEIGGQASEVVGVMPPGFRLVVPPSSGIAPDPDAWVALRPDYDNAPRGNVFLNLVARTRPGVTLASANADADRLAAHSREMYQGWADSGFDLEVVGLHEDATAGVRPFLVALFGAVGFVLLIACSNVANLLLVRSTRRERELAVRAAMGGSRLRIVRQLLAESVTLAGLGALLGSGLAWLGVRALVAMRPEDLPRLESVGIDAPVLAFTAAAGLVAAVVFGLVPALQASRVDLAASLKDRGTAGPGGRRRLLRNAVVMVEVAMTVVLLVGAGLMVRSFAALSRVDTGLDPEGVLTLRIPMPFGRYPEAEQRSALLLALQERFEAIPGVASATAGFPLPLEDRAYNGRWGLADAETDPQAFRQADYHQVLPGYFETLGTRLLEGRALSLADETDSAAVVVVDRTLAEAAFPGRSAVGERILVRAAGTTSEWVSVVGVVEDQRRTMLDPGRASVYFTTRYVGGFGGTWALRVEGDPERVAAAVRSAVAEVDPQIPVDDIRPLTAYVRDGMARTRFALVLIAVFAGIALVMSAVGLYGVLSFVVRQRTSEIGVRMAFGAERSSILGLVVGQGLLLVGVGLAAGLAAATGLTRLMASFLVQVPPNDPLTFGAIAGFFLLVGVAACALPAMRASRIDPSRALQAE